MPAPYSLDLRKKVIAVYQQEKLSCPQLAKRFNISLSSVNRYIELEKQGNLASKKGAKGRPGKIDARGYEVLESIIEQYPTITLEELSRIFYKKSKIKAGRSILSRACQKLELNHKKLSRYASERDRKEVKKNGKPI